MAQWRLRCCPYQHAAPRAGGAALGDPRCPTAGREQGAQGQDRPRGPPRPAPEASQAARRPGTARAPHPSIGVLAGQASRALRARRDTVCPAAAGTPPAPASRRRPGSEALTACTRCARSPAATRCLRPRGGRAQSPPARRARPCRGDRGAGVALTNQGCATGKK